MAGFVPGQLIGADAVKVHGLDIRVAAAADLGGLFFVGNADIACFRGMG